MAGRPRDTELEIDSLSKSYRTLIVPLTIAASYVFSLLIRFLFGLGGIGLTVGEAVNEIVKVTVSIGFIWLFLRDVKSPPYNREIPRTDAAFELLIVVVYVVIRPFSFTWFAQRATSEMAYWILVFSSAGIDYAIAVVLAIRHYLIDRLIDWRSKIVLSLKDLGVSIPRVRILVCWVATLSLLFSLIFVNAGESFQLFAQDYIQTLQIQAISQNLLHTVRVLFAWLVIEELLFRVVLQTRLEKLMPVGWAIIVQALLFSIVHIPANATYLEWGWNVLPHLANTLLLTNGLIGGYLWHRTRNLAVLILYHWTIYPLLPLVYFPSWYL